MQVWNNHYREYPLAHGQLLHHDEFVWEGASQVMTAPRILPLSTDELDQRQRAFLAPFTDGKGRYPNIFGVLCRNMPLMEAWRGFGLYTMTGTALDPVLREALILRTAHHAQSEYELHHHTRIARSLGMSEDLVTQVARGEPTGDDGQDLMVRIADDLAGNNRLSPETWDAAIAHLGETLTLDAIFVVGAYTALAMALNSCGVQIEGRNQSSGAE